MNSSRVEPLSGRKVYARTDGGIAVPMREVTLQPPNPPLRLYDTSGPYGDPDHEVDLDRGLPLLRQEWIETRGDVERQPGRGRASSSSRRRR